MCSLSLRIMISCEAIWAHSVLVISSGVAEGIVKVGGLVGGYDVDGVLRSNSEKLELVGGGLVCQVWGWLVYTTFVFGMKMPVHVCPHSWVLKTQPNH